MGASSAKKNWVSTQCCLILRWLTSKCDKSLKMGLICHENENRLQLSLNPLLRTFFNFSDFDSQPEIEKKMCEIGEIVFGGNYGGGPWGPRDILVNLWPNISSKSDILGLPYCMKIGRCRLLHIYNVNKLKWDSDQIEHSRKNKQFFQHKKCCSSWDSNPRHLIYSFS